MFLTSVKATVTSQDQFLQKKRYEAMGKFLILSMKEVISFFNEKDNPYKVVGPVK